MLEQLFETIKDFFFDLPSIQDLINGIKTGDTSVFSGFASMISGLVKRFSSPAN